MKYTTKGKKKKFKAGKDNVFSSVTLESKGEWSISRVPILLPYHRAIAKHPYSGVIYRRARKSGTETLAVFIGADIGYALASREHGGRISRRSARMNGHIPLQSCLEEPEVEKKKKKQQ